MELFAEFLDREGDPCEDSCSTAVETKGTQAETKGETLLRDSLMFDRYKQNYYHQGNKDAVRMNEIEQMEYLIMVLLEVLYMMYFMYYILFHVLIILLVYLIMISI